MSVVETSGRVEQHLRKAFGDAKALVPVGPRHVSHDELQSRKTLEDGDEVVGHAVHVVARTSAQRAGVAQDRQSELLQPRVERHHPFVGGKVATQTRMHLHTAGAHRDAPLQLFHQQVRIDPGTDVAAEERANPRVLCLPLQGPRVETAHAVMKHRQQVLGRCFRAPGALLFEHLWDHHVVQPDNRLNIIASHVLAAGIAVGPAPFQRQTPARKDNRLLLRIAAEVNMDIYDGRHLSASQIPGQASS